MVNGTQKSGWDGPLDIDWEWALTDLRRELKNAAPADSGTLRNSFNDPRTVTQSRDKRKIFIKIEPPALAWKYARIQDKGGFVPPYDIIAAKGPGSVMRAEIPRDSGTFKFFTSRRGFRLSGSNYVDRAIIAWARRLNFITISWRAGRGGQGLRTIPGGVTSAP
jgi:hypothetical protein